MRGIMGGILATPEDLDNVPCPRRTSTYNPIQHGDFRREMLTALDNAGIDKDSIREEWRLSEGWKTRDGHSPDQERGIYTGPGCRVFGLIKIGDSEGDTDLAIAVRSSVDKRIACGLTGGGETGICTNLLIWGKEQTFQVHSGNLDIARFFRGAVAKVLSTFPAFKAFIGSCKSTGVDDDTFNGFIVDGLEAGILPGRAANHMVDAWRRNVAPKIGDWDGLQTRLDDEVYEERTAWTVRGLWEEIVGNRMNRTGGNELINNQSTVNEILASRCGVALTA